MVDAAWAVGAMTSTMVSVRLEERLLEWTDSYAKERGVSRTELIEQALLEYRELAASGVPQLRQRMRDRDREVQVCRPSREDFARASAERAALFARLRTPDSVKGVPARSKRDEAS